MRKNNMKANENRNIMTEGINMVHKISTGRFIHYGQLEDQANGTADIEAFVYRNGEIIPAEEAETLGTPVINTATEKNFAW